MRLASSWLPVLLFLGAAVVVPAIVPDVAVINGDVTESTGGSRTHHVIDVTVTAITCPEGYHSGFGDHVCLAYDGAIPGPTWLFHEGDTVEMRVTNAIWPSILATGLTPEDPAWTELTTGNVSLHRHGIAVAATDDGIPHVDGTRLADSTAGPNATVEYRFETRFPGAWHYHDHVLGEYMAGGKKRGLYGAFLTLPQGKDSQVLDLHLKDHGVHGGLGYSANVTAGERFDLVVVGLGNFWWSVTLKDPSGAIVGMVPDIGPGVSRAITVEDPVSGTYTWTARTPFFRNAFTGEVVAQ